MTETDDTDDAREAEAWVIHDGQARIVYDADTAMLEVFAQNGFTAMSIGEGLLKAGGNMLLIGAGPPPPRRESHPSPTSDQTP